MLTTKPTLTLITLLACLSTTAAAAAPKATTGRATIRGVDYSYEIHGRGEPLLLLHGGLGSTDMFDPILPALTKSRQVIAVDLQGHGRSTLGDRPIRCEDIADDLDTLLGKIGRAKVDVLGYSFGGCVGLRLAVQHPKRVRRLALVSAPFSDDGWHPEVRAQQNHVSGAMAPMMAEMPLYKTYAAVAPKPDDFPRLLDAMGAFMRRKYDWSADVKKLEGPVLLVYGDADMTRPEHEIAFFRLLGGGLKDAGWNREHMPKNRLAILPDLTHYEIGVSSRMVDTVLRFLDHRERAERRGAEAPGASGATGSRGH